MANSFPPVNAVVVTLQQAVEKCKKYNGIFYQRGTNVRCRLDKNLNVVMESNGNPFELNAWDFDKEWIYEPPKQSAFEKWDKNHTHLIQYPDDPRKTTKTELRKEDWNAAIDEINRKYKTGDANDEFFREVLTELKEP